MTPYAVSELVYDWRAFETDRVKLAVVARETLDEARGFAEGHGFTPAGFAAMPPQERFPACRSSNWRRARRTCPFPTRASPSAPTRSARSRRRPAPESDAASSEETVSADPGPTMWTRGTGDNTPDAPVEAEAPDPDGEDPGPDRDAAAEPPTGPDAEAPDAPSPRRRPNWRPLSPTRRTSHSTKRRIATPKRSSPPPPTCRPPPSNPWRRSTPPTHRPRRTCRTPPTGSTPGRRRSRIARSPNPSRRSTTAAPNRTMTPGPA
jgi:hypothetical protein